MTTLMPGHAPLNDHPFVNLFPLLDEPEFADWPTTLSRTAAVPHGPDGQRGVLRRKPNKEVKP